MANVQRNLNGPRGDTFCDGNSYKINRGSPSTGRTGVRNRCFGNGRRRKKRKKKGAGPAERRHSRPTGQDVRGGEGGAEERKLSL